MGILLVRHSDAVEGGGDVDDAARWLSLAGRARALASADKLRAKYCSRPNARASTALTFARFVTSPRVRAVQTAELYARTLGFTGSVESLPALSFSEPAQHAVEALRVYRGNVAAFGHMPTIAEIVMRLAGEARPVAMATSEAVFIESGRVMWRLSPEDGT
jgi:phosphohistidine phosphatase SixA